MFFIKNYLTLAALLFSVSLFSQQTSNHGKAFEQLDNVLPGPTPYRGIDGAPGPEYWQQRADYDIKCTLDTENLQLRGKEKITYYNQSPHTLKYIWLQLDENQHQGHLDHHHFNASSMEEEMNEKALMMLEVWNDDNKYGHNIEAVTDANGKPLKHTINATMMRIDLPERLKPNEQFTFNVDWNYYITDRKGAFRGRGGYEYFEDNENYLFTITQWFPRLCVYSDREGWQNKQFTGRGEFALTFGDYKVEMTVPDDYVVGSTGECQNYDKMLSKTQLKRFEKSKSAKEPLEIITLEEAKANANSPKSKKTKTWVYHAENVRDFAWTASRKYVWDAMPHYNEDGKQVMCMSYYPKESYPIYSKYSTKAVELTLRTYSKYSIPYPYPVAISVEAANGMEYPMICFNYGRAEADGTYTERNKNGAISVIVHEVGHNYFPMIINSDERKWSWMDEGINTFVQFLALSEFDNNWPHRRGPAHKITSYMDNDPSQLEPIMTNSDNIISFGSNAYAKPATGLNILRETIMGRELFDMAFKEYCERWAFKHPTPADFFRTMEDASGEDLDWFWRGWFYNIDPVDISMDTVVWMKADLENDPTEKITSEKITKEKPFDDIAKIRNKKSGMKFDVDKDPDLVDFYTTYKPWETEDSVQYKKTEKITFSKEEKKKYADKNYYQLKFTNHGMVMPIILEWEFEDGTKEIERIAAEVWRKNENELKKVFVKNKEVKNVRLDPYRETADIDLTNNSSPVPDTPELFKVYKEDKEQKRLNPMQKAKGIIKP